MVTYVVEVEDEAATRLSLVGGKGAGLAALVRTPGVRVPAAFCVTTEAYRAVLAAAALDPLLDRLAGLAADDGAVIAATSAAIRTALEATPIPAEVVEQIDRHLAALGDRSPVAVRSSATAEDLPSASFAGQQESYLNVRGRADVLRSISRCWASLFTERAVTYRLRNGFDQRGVELAVVVQQMVFPEAAGVLFTADPLTSDRKACSVDASFGLGEAVVSGLVDTDHYLVTDGRIVDRRVAAKRTVVRPLAGGGTGTTTVDPGRQTRPALTDDQVLRLARLGRTIEANLGRPQDIEWCLIDGDFCVVQSRPITTLFPLPDLPAGSARVYMSFGHQQMMTDAMTPLGLSFFVAQFEEDALPTVEVAGRIFLDLSHDLASPIGRLTLRLVMGGIDPIMLNAMKVLIRRRAFMRSLPRGRRYFSMGSGYFTWRLPVEAIRAYRGNDPDLVPALMAERRARLEATRRTVEGLSGEAVFDAIRQDFRQLKQDIQDPRGMGIIYAGIVAQALVDRTARRTLRDKAAGTVLARAVAHDVTAEMGVALLDVADVVRGHPEVMAGLARLGDADFFDRLERLEGGPETTAAIRGFLDRYGMRCAGEIDITRPRWNEQPTALVPMILSAVRTLGPDARQGFTEAAVEAADAKERELLDRIRRQPGGRRRARRVARTISRMRNLAGYREYPKYLMVGHYWMIKQALMREADGLAREGVIEAPDDVRFLTLDEFREAVRTRRVDGAVIAARRARFALDARLTPPRVMTSEGEVFTGGYDTSRMPAGALPGIAASPGTVEGRARVILSMEQADLEPGDILVTTFTDPSWTPAFLSITGLVTEVGGRATHGSVIAREYGLPAVVGVENVTRLIPDGRRIRVNGTEGYVQLL